jgi:asparagine synthase (glutamine-hydrolysing)
MCGIAGWLGHQDNANGLASTIAWTLRHRGPDGQGIWITPDASLVHTRLSIIDLSSAGKQPMSNETGTVWCVFNGEIYNHRELRHRLERAGHRFKGYSDCEILPHLYEEEGARFVELLRGMFAFAIYDTRTKELLLVRDHFGIKPLFYAAFPNGLAFASEINALRHVPGINLTVDRQAIYDYAALHYIPAPETFYQGIRALDAGELLEARLDTHSVSFRTKRYHVWVIAPNFDLSLGQAVDQAQDLIATAVQRQMESDVPLGSLLSGGIDSSLVSVAAQKAAGGSFRTFNVQFADKEYDETWAALAVAEHIHSRHKTLDMQGDRGAWDDICQLLLHAGQPFADTSLFGVNAVSRVMRQHVTVALSGDGGDEGFGGYSHFWLIESIVKWQRLPASLLRIGAMGLIPLAQVGFIPSRMPQRLSGLAGADDVGIIENLFSWTRENELKHLCIDHGKSDPIRRLFESKWAHHLPPRVSRIERLSALATEVGLRLTLPNDYLFKVDTASMKESLEVRVPMLDEDLIAFGLSLPHTLKVKHQTGKRVLRGVAQRQLPSEVANKPKWGFGVPVDRWVGSDFKLALRDRLLGPSSRLPEYFMRKSYAPVVEAFCENRLDHSVSRGGLYQRVIMLLSVQLFLEQHAVSTGA